MRVLEFRTGSGFEFDVVVDRAFDIGRCEMRGLALGWQSPAGFGGPWFAEYEGLGWFRNWGGGFVTTCGLEHAAFMAEDTAEHYHYPAKQTETFGLHGRDFQSPGDSERATVPNGLATNACSGPRPTSMQASVFGENLVLRRRIEAMVGSSTFTMHDTVTNEGWNPTPHMCLYHVNVGFPILDEGAELLVPTRSAMPLGDYSAENYTKLDAPEAGSH